jgi:hypothetical protein
MKKINGMKILLGLKLMVFKVYKGFKSREWTDRDILRGFNLLTNDS